MKNGDFSGLVDASGRPDPDLRPGDRPRRQRRVDARSVPGQHHPGRTASTRRPGRSCSTTRIRTAPRPASRRGSRTCTTPSTSTRTCSGTGSARSTTTSAPTTAPSSAGARTSATRSRNHQRDPQRSRPRTASCRSGAPTARSSATGCTSSAPGRSSTCAAATPTSWSGAIPRTRSVSMRPSSGPRASSARCPASAIGGIFPRIEIDQFVEPVARHRPRTGTGTTRFSRTCR